MVGGTAVEKSGTQKICMVGFSKTQCNFKFGVRRDPRRDAGRALAKFGASSAGNANIQLFCMKLFQEFNALFDLMFGQGSVCTARWGATRKIPAGSSTFEP
jgi:hypothetical protein